VSDRIKKSVMGSALLGAMALIGAGAYSLHGGTGAQEGGSPTSAVQARPKEEPAVPKVEVTAAQVEGFKIKPVQEREFTLAREAVGSIAFNEEMSVDVYPQVQGKILKLFASAGDDVADKAALYSIESPDLVQAGSTLISAAGVLELTTRALKRARELQQVQGVAQKDLDQAISDQQAAEASYKAARDAVRIFGKTDAEMDQIVAERKIDRALVVHSPIAGRVTARNAAPGMLAQPGNPPAPYTVADVSTMWMLADVAETDFSAVKLGQAIAVKVKAYPDRVFRGKIVNIGASVDPSTRRVTVRSVVSDPDHELRSGMFATFVIEVGKVKSLAVPQNGVIREGDGSYSVWVTTDKKTMLRKTVSVGIQEGGMMQIVKGLSAGEQAATEEAIFLSNALAESSK
jgi:cobalt-zinc-cadmium efflux system membrane fusion protein